MTFEEILDQAIAMLQRRGRLTYGTLKRQFQLDDAALLIHGQALTVNQLVLQVIQRGIVELKLPLEGPIGQAAPLAQEGDHLIYHCDKVQPVSSLPDALSEDACASPSYHKQQGGR